MTTESYAMSSSGGTPLRRIRTPHPHDVLSGRGGGINAHPGNKVFRDWVRLRKEDYNLAPNKAEKTRVALEVMDQVKQQNPPGRFLQKDTSVASGPVWWIEVDEARALAKTSQALREGAPQIRLQHKEELIERAEKAKRRGGKRKRKPVATGVTATTRKSPSVAVAETRSGESYNQSTNNVPASVPVVPQKPLRRLPTDEYNQAMENLQANVREAKSLAEKQQQEESSPQRPQVVAPLMSNSDFKQKYWSPINKRPRFDYPFSSSQNTTPSNNYDYNDVNSSNEPPSIDVFGETPPLMAAPTPPIHDEMPPFRLDSPPKKQSFNGRSSSSSSRNGQGSRSGLTRVHSLALSDFSMSDTNVLNDHGEFVNPFEDESDIADRLLLDTSDKSNPGNNEQNGTSQETLRNLSSNSEEPESPAMSWGDHNPRTNTEMTDLNPTDENYHHSSDFHGSWETDFGEGMKSILDVVHPELTTPEKGEKLPTLLMPWRGSVGGGILSSSNNKTKAKSNGNANNNLSIRRSSVSSRLWGLNGRQ